MNEERARALLPHTWHAFFGRFGRLTATQKAAILPILSGKSVVLCAPTASGKTEAVLGPLMERLIHEDRNRANVRMLVVCPTRALCNDLHRRIHRPFAAASWTAEIKTGDAPDISEESPPQVVVTTPESFDSLMSRRPQVLRHVDALFLDELHLLAGSARGDQLQALVWRLFSFRPDLQVCAASATAADAVRLAREFCPGPAEVVVADGGNRDREIEAELVQAVFIEDAAREIRALMQEQPGTKMLAFANTRAEVEWLAADLTDLNAFAHHGSLSKSERLRAEEGFLRASSGVCVATMTLELGVDIGDVDRVVLINPPPNVASFTQRIGRSNRRGGAIRASCLYSSDFDARRFEHLIDCAEEGRLFPEAVFFRPGVIAQQAVSLLFQNPKGWVNKEAAHKRLPPEVGDFYSVRDVEGVLKKMRDEGYLHADSKGRYVADEPATKDYRYGRIHAHIDATAEVEIVDEATGRTIGRAAYSDQERQKGVTSLLLAGKHREITRVREDRVFVESSGEHGEASFLSRMGPLYSFGLARDLAGHLGFADNEIRLVRKGGGGWSVQHYFGSVWGRLLAAVLRNRGFSIKGVGAFQLGECKKRSGKLAQNFGPSETIEEEVRLWLQGGYKEFLKPLQAGPWARFVPDELHRRWVIECVRPEAFAEALARFELHEV